MQRDIDFKLLKMQWTGSKPVIVTAEVLFELRKNIRNLHLILRKHRDCSDKNSWIVHKTWNAPSNVQWYLPCQSTTIQVDFPLESAAVFKWSMKLIIMFKIFIKLPRFRWRTPTSGGLASRRWRRLWPWSWTWCWRRTRVWGWLSRNWWRCRSRFPCGLCHLFFTICSPQNRIYKREENKPGKFNRTRSPIRSYEHKQRLWQTSIK